LSVSHPSIFKREQAGHVHEDLASFAILAREKIGKSQKLILFRLSVVDDDKRPSLEKSGLEVYLAGIERVTWSIAARIGLADVAQPIELPA
jgi:hypothetical protein